MGYTGGQKDDPTYRSLGDHSEGIQVEFDPEQVRYEELLDIFWSDHNPTQHMWSKQYRAAIFFHDEKQKEIALRSRDRIASHEGGSVTTDIEPAGPFYPAEDYHQKYYLRREGSLLKEYLATYPETGDLVRSTAVARVNGYLGGNGTIEDLKAEIDGFGLSPEGIKRLEEYVKTISPQRACPLRARK